MDHTFQWFYICSRLRVYVRSCWSLYNTSHNSRSCPWPCHRADLSCQFNCVCNKRHNAIGRLHMESCRSCEGVSFLEQQLHCHRLKGIVRFYLFILLVGLLVCSESFFANARRHLREKLRLLLQNVCKIKTACLRQMGNVDSDFEFLDWI